MFCPKLRYTGLILGICLLVASCKKDKDDLLDPVPVIESVSLSKTNIVEFQDSLVFTLTYRDGDGDLGENSPNAHNLFLIDNRINITEQFRIRELAPEGADVPITGTLRVVLRSTGITDNSNSQTYNYTLYIQDRAGNESNRINTEDITITK